ncbi:hypothetical protein NEISICOT_00363 [Neisseria sicca ATCC 29256]|uniref:Uncharacterized protein n=1 Tax=Neisseria sicca ATCC 29256 TaxID=547045 RepID=C6M1I0_NEISI|nr:hypothetical protein NEISICOT_00363 [Neisseria sicca ATCC 29256]
MGCPFDGRVSPKYGVGWRPYYIVDCREWAKGRLKPKLVFRRPFSV